MLYVIGPQKSNVLMIHENIVQCCKDMYMYVFCEFFYHSSCILATLADHELHSPDKESQTEERSKPFLEFIISICFVYFSHKTYTFNI